MVVLRLLGSTSAIVRQDRPTMLYSFPRTTHMDIPHVQRASRSFVNGRGHGRKQPIVIVVHHRAALKIGKSGHFDRRLVLCRWLEQASKTLIVRGGVPLSVDRLRIWVAPPAAWPALPR